MITDEILSEVERMAAQGMPLSSIGARLGYSAADWLQECEDNEPILATFSKGRAIGSDEMYALLSRQAERGNVSAQRAILKAFEEPELSSDPVAEVSVNPLSEEQWEAIETDIDWLFDHQRVLMDPDMTPDEKRESLEKLGPRPD